MIPAAFDYVRADSVDVALAALAGAGEDAKLLAGGHSLIPLMRFRLVTPSVLVDVGRLDDLRYVRRENGQVAIGALTRHSELEFSDVLAEHCPMLRHVAGLVGDPAVRHHGTIGGSLAHADPASDLPAAVLALGGTLVAQSTSGRREIPAESFFTGFLESALAPDEVLVEVRVPADSGGWAYEKFNRRAQDWAIVGVAVARGGAGVALVNMGSTPLRATAVEAALAAGASVGDAAASAADGAEPPTDNNGDADYRAHLARVLTERALIAAGIA
jgi:aerobic carbon-monoxide dehydrogenase medium subunit